MNIKPLVVTCPCPECEGRGWFADGDMECCGGSEWECGASGCTGPNATFKEAECPYCLGSGEIDA